ncbi:MAG: hypothetical protein QW534_07095 [Candidatus Methanomethylicia archaeon]
MDRPLTEVLIAFIMVAITCLSIPLTSSFLLNTEYASSSLNAKYCINVLALAISRASRVSTPQTISLPCTIGVHANNTIVTVSIGYASESMDVGIHVFGGGVSNCFTVWFNNSYVIVKSEVVK